ncbi:DUF397 domain-containing protein [Streptomonospora nanhaiensis]|uniref:DUF397 domain-containing protein n=1 Tax=Streptomonospora nanhaiensis TaxID=1323731 RepID=UPI001C382B04|nr:DUF397 domain-containing protein [Streptomonospora nanhaiensis]MBV2363856.1 DUF397 domain-containing protein [Streptomonospora nanhaiensis]MBX9389878.1 DUF397 domain-containing protein [Streptomonospora nanhaiensis]
MTWHKSSYSGPDNANCVEVAEGAQTLVRDTQNPHLGHLAFPAPEWDAFLTAIRNDTL